MKIKQFFQELKRRSVYKVAVTYAIVAWFLLQLVSVITPMIDAPHWIPKAILIFLVVGFPISLILAWAFEMSPKEVVLRASGTETKNTSSDENKILTISNLVIGLLVIIVLGQIVYSRISQNGDKNNETETASTTELSIAVLPLLNLNSKKENLEYFSDGVTNEIIEELAKIRSFVVSPFTLSLLYKGTSKTQEEIAEELNVKYLLAGSNWIYSSGDSVKLTIELINPLTKRRLWGQTFGVEMSDAPRIQSSIARTVAEHLNVELSPAEKSALEKINTTSGEAFRLFLKGKGEFSTLTSEGFKNATPYLEKALEIDPYYAQAHTLYAWNLVLSQSIWLTGDAVSTTIIDSIVSPHLAKAMELDPTSSDSYLVRANLNLLNRARMRDAKRDVDYALELNSWPRIPTDYCICTVVTTYVALGKYEEAQKLADIAHKVDPENLFIYFDQATIHFAQGNKKEAQAVFEDAVKAADNAFFNFFLGWSYYHDGQYKRSLPYFERALHLEKVPLPINTAYLSNVHYKLKNEEMSEYYKTLMTELMKQGVANRNLSMSIIYAGRENKEETLYWLEKAYDKRDHAIAWFMNVDPIFQPYLDDPRVRNLREKMQYFE